MSHCPRCGALSGHYGVCPDAAPADAGRSLLATVRAMGLVPLADDEDEESTLPARPGYVVTERSRFSEEGHIDCDCMSCRPYTS